MQGLEHLVERLDHVSVAVRDIADVPAMAQLMGGTFRNGGYHASSGFRWVQFDVPGGKIEYVQPVTDDCFLHDFLERRGEGIHHLTFKVSSLTQAVERAEALGFRVVGINTESDRWKEAFVHPKSAHGTLIQLAEFSDSPPPADRTFDDVLRMGP